MPRNLYSPRLSDDVVRALYREGQRRRQPMTIVADDLLRQALSHPADEPPSMLRIREDPQRRRANKAPVAAMASVSHPRPPETRQSTAFRRSNPKPQTSCPQPPWPSN
jgi:hypothetical protein